jgi:hypothetical protein
MHFMASFGGFNPHLSRAFFELPSRFLDRD